jgi:site-specific recombinase XerD
MKPKKASIKIRDFKRHVDDWCALRAAMHHQPASIVAGQKDLRVFVRFCKEKHVRRINGNTLIVFFAYLADTRKNCSGSINRKRSTLRCYLDHLRLRQVPGAASFPMEYVPRARQAYKGPIHTLEPHEVMRLLDSIDRSTVIGIRDFTIFSLLYAIGLRLGECLTIRLQDIHWEKEMLTINGKGRKIRYIPLTEKIAKLLKTWIKHRRELLNAGTSEYLFLSKKGNPLSARRAEERFQDIVQKNAPLSVKKVTPHSLRHAFASHAVEGDADLLVLKTILGHASLKTTELYLHPSINKMRAALNDHLASDILKDIRYREVGVVGMRINGKRKSTACGT